MRTLGAFSLGYSFLWMRCLNAWGFEDRMMKFPDLNRATSDHPGLAAKVEALFRELENSQPLMVAYSGGVDSSCLLALANRGTGGSVLGVIADSPSLPRRALADAIQQAERMGAPLEVLETREFEDDRYAANPMNRCYFCKAELFSRMNALAKERGFAAIAYGENADDMPGLRPGSAAAAEFSVIAPLRSAGITKAEVRTLARALGLSSSEAPAQPCLSSRIPHGTPVTRDNVALVERGEEAMRELGFSVLRVRLEAAQPPRALVQVAPAELAVLFQRELAVKEALHSVGFESISLDPEGYRGAGLK
jgi:uncharacterized protein